MKKISILIFLIISGQQLFAQSGVLDATFGTGGSVQGPFSSLSTHFGDLARQSDGKYIVVGGETTPAFTYNLITMRFNANGSVDNTYGISGKTEYDFSMPTFTEDYSVAIQSTGKIVISARAAGAIGGTIVLRYLSTGVLDNTFGVSGVFTDYDSYISEIAVQSDDKIIMVGFNDGSSYKSSVSRLTANGQLDNSFGTSGVALYTEVGKEAGANSVVIQPDGHIVVVGMTGVDFDYDAREFMVLRYTTSGVLDNTFNGNGTFSLNVKEKDIATSVGLQSDGKILVVGHVDTNFMADVMLIRLTSGGSLDPTFNGVGKVLIPGSGLGTYPESVLFQNDGGIIVAGHISTSLNQAVLYKFTAGGTPDVTFGVNGVAKLMGSRDFTTKAAILQPDNKIVLAGESFDLFTANYGYFLGRFGNGATPNITNDLVQSKTVSIYPNPASNDLNIEIKMNYTTGSYQINSLAGGIIKQGTLNNSKTVVSLGQISKGTYQINITLDNERFSKLISIIK